MPRLRVLDVSGLGLKGELPTWLTEESALIQLDLQGNHFTAPSLWSAGGNATETTQSVGADGAIGEPMQAIVTQCRANARLACKGLPPASCAAFGPDFKLRIEDPTRCTYCDPLLFAKTVGLLIGAVGGTCLTLVVYVMLISGRHAKAMNRWVSTLSLFFAHLQTIAVIGNLALDWPPRAKAITGALSLSIASASFLRPEVPRPCLSPAVAPHGLVSVLAQALDARRPSTLACSQCLLEVVNPFIVFSVGQMLVTWSVLLLTMALAHCPSRCLSVAHQTKVWFVQTVVVQFVFCSSWRLSLTTLLHIGQGGEYTLGAFIAVALLLTLSYNIWTFYRQIRWALQLARDLSTDSASQDVRGRVSQRFNLQLLIRRSGHLSGKYSAKWVQHSVENSGSLMAATPPHTAGKSDEASRPALVTFRDGPEREAAPGNVKGADGQRELDGGHRARAGNHSWRTDAAEECLMLQARMSYLTGRFAKHAPQWQFVTWARALCLMLSTVGARTIATEHAATKRGVAWAQASIAVVIMLVAFRLHRKVSAT